jgi:hypothetical protein
VKLNDVSVVAEDAVVLERWRPKMSEVSVLGVNWDGEVIEGEREGMPILAVEAGMTTGAGIAGRPPRRMEIVPVGTSELVIWRKGERVRTEVWNYKLSHVTAVACVPCRPAALPEVHLELGEHFLENFGALERHFTTLLG